MKYIYTIKITVILTLEMIYDIYYINNVTQCDNKVGMLLQIGLRVVYNKYIRQMKSVRCKIKLQKVVNTLDM